MDVWQERCQPEILPINHSANQPAYIRACNRSYTFSVEVADAGAVAVARSVEVAVARNVEVAVAVAVLVAIAAAVAVVVTVAVAVAVVSYR